MTGECLRMNCRVSRLYLQLLEGQQEEQQVQIHKQHQEERGPVLRRRLRAAGKSAEGTKVFTPC